MASPASLKTQLSRWENGHATPEAPYRALLAELYAESGPELPFPDHGPAATGPVERLQARLAAAAAVDAEVIALWRTQLATAQQLDRRLGAAGAATAVRALLEQLDAVLPHLPDPDRHRAVAALLPGPACSPAPRPSTRATRTRPSARFFRAAELAGRRRPDLAVEAAIGHAERAARGAARRATHSRSWSTRAWTSPTHHPGSRGARPRTGPTPRRPTRSSTWPPP